MFKYIYLIVLFLAILNRLIVITKTLKMKKIKGKVYAQWITKLVFIFYVLVFFAPPIEFFIVKRQINYYISVTAFLIYIIGMILWLWAMKTLGKFWSTEIEIRDNHPLIKKGPYKYMRHPHYLFIFCELFGLPLIPNAYYSLIVIAIIFIPLIVLRTVYEEKAMIEKFSNEYLKYKKEVWAFFPIPIFKLGVKNETEQR